LIKRVSRLKRVKTENRKSIAMILYKEGSASRLELAKRLQLTKSAISILTAEMIEQGLILETGNYIEKKSSGPRERLLALSGGYGCALGINIERDYVSIGVCNLRNKTIKNNSFRTSCFGSDVKVFLSQVAEKAAVLLAEAQPVNLLGCAVTIIGKVDQRCGTSINSFGLIPRNTAIAAYFAEKFGTTVLVENNVRALAMANYNFHSGAEEKNCIFLKHGQGFGGAIIVDSKLITGSANEAGEIGHTVVAGNKRICSCGRRGCLETLVREKTILEPISLQCYPILSHLCRGKQDNLEMEKVLAAIDKGEVSLLKHFESPLEYLAQSIANLYILINPHVIILYGFLFQNTRVLELLYRNLKRILKSDKILCLLKVSLLESKKNYYGATDLVLRNYFEGGAVPV